MNYILIQVIGFVGTALFFLSYQCRTNKNLFRVQMASYLFYTVHLLLLGAVTGGMSYILNIIRSFCLGSDKCILRSKWMCIAICMLQVTTLVAAWSGWWSVLPIVANVATTIGGYTYDARKIRLVGMLINSPLWIIYDILIGSWAGILDEFVSEASIIISIARYGWNDIEETHKV